MNLLLDTCAVFALASGTLKAKGREALRTAQAAVIPPVVPWEIAIKSKVGKLTIPQPPLAYVQALAERHGLTLAPEALDAALLCAAADLPLIHRDPIDRILVALARRDDFTVLTSDQTIPAYPGLRCLW